MKDEEIIMYLMRKVIELKDRVEFLERYIDVQNEIIADAINKKPLEGKDI